MDKERMWKILNIKERRKQLGISQGELAKRCGITQSSLCDIEQGRLVPSIETTIKIANALNIEIDTTVKDSYKMYENLNNFRDNLLSKKGE